jgi:hypothetical protein
MAEEVYMDVPRMEQVSNSFESFGSVLEGVSKAMLAISKALKAAAWISAGATAAYATYLDRIRPNVDKLANKMHELSGDITGAIKAYRDGDLSGSKRFV